MGKARWEKSLRQTQGLSRFDRGGVTEDKILRVNNRHTDPVGQEEVRENEYLSFLRKCSIHAKWVGDFEIAKKIWVMRSAWKPYYAQKQGPELPLVLDVKRLIQIGNRVWSGIEVARYRNLARFVPKDPVRGLTADLIFIDEASEVTEDAWNAIN
jgi:hypothetical protein